MEVLYGLHPVEEAIRSGLRRLNHVSMARERRDDRLEKLVRLCQAAGVRVTYESKETLARLAGTDMHQGVLAVLQDRKFLTIEDLVQTEKEGYRFFLALDGLEDPHNLGALLRTAEGAGVDGVILPERRAASVTGTVAKTSAGASEHIRIARVTNLVRSLELLKQKNVWVVGLDERGSQEYTDFDFKTDCVLVLGREGAGLHDLVRKTCDHLLSIPMAGHVSSLNVSVAGAVVMYEAMRQRRQQAEVASAPAAPLSQKKRKGLGS